MSRTACTEPQCLYRASVHVQSLSVCTEPQCLYRASVSVQSLSACTELQCLYRASVSVQSLSVCREPQCLYRASLPVQSLSVCTEPQCLYNGALYITLYNMGLYDVGTEKFTFYLFHCTPSYKKKHMDRTEIFGGISELAIGTSYLSNTFCNQSVFLNNGNVTRHSCVKSHEVCLNMDVRAEKSMCNVKCLLQKSHTCTA